MMTLTSKIIKIGIFGHYGNKNLGDESIIEAVIQNIKERTPETEIIGLSINPIDTYSRYNIESFPIRRISSKKKVVSEQSGSKGSIIHSSIDRNMGISKIVSTAKRIPIMGVGFKLIGRLLSLLKAVVQELCFYKQIYSVTKNLDLLMITGSNQFLDNFGGPWGFPYTLLKWSAIAKLTKTQVKFVSVGAGPIAHRMSRWLIRATLLFADYVSLRDQSSEKLIKEIGCRMRTNVFPDLAHSLSINHIKKNIIKRAVSEDTEKPTIGINPMPLYDSRYWCEKDENKYIRYVNKLVDFSGLLIDEGYPFFFFATQEKDTNVIEDVLERLGQQRNYNCTYKDFTHPSKTVDELMAIIACADIIVATRFHGTVLSLLSEKPMIGICYYRKAMELLIDMGQGNYAVELDNFTVKQVWDKFKDLIQNYGNEKDKIIKKNSEYSSLLKDQYGEILDEIYANRLKLN